MNKRELRNTPSPAQMSGDIVESAEEFSAPQTAAAKPQKSDAGKRSKISKLVATVEHKSFADSGDLKLALDDVRARHTALVNLIIFTDQKAMAVFRLYVTLGIAAGAAGAASFFRDDALLQFARWSMIASAFWLAIGAIFCLRAMSRTAINLPGRGPEFWLWAMGPQYNTKEVVEGYLKSLEEKQAINRALNEKTANALHVAVMMGIATPFILATGAAIPLIYHL